MGMPHACYLFMDTDYSDAALGMVCAIIHFHASSWSEQLLDPVARPLRIANVIIVAITKPFSPV